MKRKNPVLKENTASEKMTTLSASVNEAAKKGYNANFKIEENGMLWDGNGCRYVPDEVMIDNFYRFEGESDPADNSILYLITTIDGKQGTLVDAYGAYDDLRVSEFIRDVDNIQKQKHDDINRNRRVLKLVSIAGLLLLAGALACSRSVKKRRRSFSFLY